MTTKLTTRQKDKLIESAQNAIEFQVQGRGEFPTDMLRYDLCWPATEGDSHSIDTWRALVTAETGRRFAPRQITLRGLKPPTFTRWRSFGWEVVE